MKATSDTLATFSEVLKKHQIERPERVCVQTLVSGKKTPLTYSDIERNSRIAAHVLSQFTKPGDRVLLAMNTSPEFIYILFGCFISKRIPVPIPVEKSTSRFSRFDAVVNDCIPAVIVCGDRLGFESMNLGGDEYTATKAIIWSEQDLNDAALFDTNSVKVRPNTVALIQYTSGSTSAPKGVVLTHQNILNNIGMIQGAMQITPDDRVVSWLPLHHDMGLVGMLLTFFKISALTTLIPYQEFSKDPIIWVRVISELKATLSGAPNFAFTLLADRLNKQPDKSFDLSNLRLLYCGAERIFPSSISAFYNSNALTGLRPDSFFPCYGMAEASLFIAGGNVAPERLLDTNKKYATCGPIARDIDLTVEVDGEPLSDGNIGEIHISGSNVSPGYWLDIYQAVSEGDLPSEKHNKLNTGDMGLKEGSEVVITGRADDLICFRGKNIYPDDLEQAIEHENIYLNTGSVVAISTDENNSETITIVAEIRRDKRKSNFDLLFREIQSTLSESQLAAKRLVVISPMGLPKTSSGKKQRNLTKQMLYDGKLKILWSSDNDLVSKNEVHQTAISPTLVEMADYLAHNNVANDSDEKRTYPADFVHFLSQQKMLGLLIPKSLGGEGLSHRGFSVFGQALGELDLTVGAMVGNHNTIGVLPILYSEVLANRKEVLRDIAAGSAIAAYALTEPSAGSNPRAIESVAVPTKSGFTLTGSKIWIGNARFAKYISVFCKELDANGAEIGISAFLLDRTRHNFRIGENFRTMGLRAMDQSEVIFPSVHLEEQDRLSLPGSGLELGFRCMEYARFGLASLSLGAIKKALSITTEFTQGRQVWTGQLSDNHYVKVELELIRLNQSVLSALVDHCAVTLEKDGVLPSILSSSCKIVSGEWTWKSIDKCMQFCGGRGYIEDFGLAKLMRDIRIVRVFEGPTETLAYQLGAQVCRSPNKITSLISESGCSCLIDTIELETLCIESAEIPAQYLYVVVGEIFSQLLTYNIYLHRMKQDSIRTEIESAVSEVTAIAKIKLERISRSQTQKVNTERESNKDYEVDEQLNNVSKIQIDQSKTSTEKPNNTARHSKSFSGGDSVKKHLTEWLKQNTKRNVVETSVPLVEYGLDSLLGYELVCFIEEKFDQTFDISVVDANTSIDSLADSIAAANIATEKA